MVDAGRQSLTLQLLPREKGMSMKLLQIKIFNAVLYVVNEKHIRSLQSIEVYAPAMNIIIVFTSEW